MSDVAALVLGCCSQQPLFPPLLLKPTKLLPHTRLFFPSRWYINSAIGLELAPKWPFTNWDDWQVAWMFV